MAAYAPNAMTIRPPARPSRPSVMFVEFAVAVMMKINNGMYHQPTSKSPTPGMWIMS